MSAGPGSPWLLCRHRRPDAPVRLYCFPHSGGSAGEFLLWADDLPGVEVWGVQLPGRGGRLDEEPHTAMPELVAALADGAAFAPPYAFFGHSLGATVAYELTLALRERGRPLPAVLYASAHEAPQLRHPDRALPLLADRALFDAVREQFGPVPAELLDDPDWRSLVLGPLRADLTVVAGYEPTPAAPLDLPVVALGGTDDAGVSRADLAGWAACTRAAFDLRMFAGGHFYLRERHDDLLRRLATDLARLPGGAVPGAAAVGPAAPVPGAGAGRARPR